ncbi:MAG: alpha/beta fold hydrolase [Chloroflexi bacterium]|nr:alpha/beta fold hydrolase [Chloroflexota bacterium]
MPHARVNDCNLYYELHGERFPPPPLVFLSGLGGHVAEIPHLVRSYGSAVRFLSFDGRGCGRSEVTPGPYSIAAYAEDAAALFDVLGIDAAVVYGSSMGGMVAQELTLRHPERVRALILGCTTASSMRGVRPTDETVMQLVKNQSLSGDEAILAGWRLGYSAAYIEAHHDEMMARSREAQSVSTPAESYMRQVIAAAQHDALDRLHEIRCPVMIIHGAEDLMLPPQNAELLRERMPHAELRILQGMGHGYNLEAQEEADALVLDFYRRHSGIAPATVEASRAVR